jgi:hypothetical protein
MKKRTFFFVFGKTFMMVTLLSCSGGSKVSYSAGQDSVVTKSTFKKGARYERDYFKGKLTETRVFYGMQLVERYPIFKESLLPSRISLRSGNNFLTKDGIDTLDVVNQDIPPGNFGFQVSSATILSRVSHGIYVLKHAPSRNPYHDTIRVLIHVLQPENRQLGTGSFISDSAFFIVQ